MYSGSLNVVVIYVIHLFSQKQTGRVLYISFIPLCREPVVFVYPGASSQLAPSQLPDSCI